MIKTRTVWLAAFLCVGCAMLPEPELSPVQVHYLVQSDWEGAELVDGARVFETDLGYTVGVSSFGLKTTSVELVPCELEEEEPIEDFEQALSLLQLRPRRAFAHGGDYDHDISVVEPGVFDDVMIEEEVVRGYSVASYSTYCDLFSVHGTGRDERVAAITGWYQVPGSDDVVPFVAEHPLGITNIAPLPVGDWDESLLPHEAEIVITRYPVRAFDGLEIDMLPMIDLAYEVSQRLLQTREVSWRIGPSVE